MFNNKVILITGGTGSFGKAFTNTLLTKYKKIKKLIIFSRDEFKQSELRKIFPETKHKCIRYFLGDVRDLKRLNLAFKDVDYVVHAAALKQVDTAEYNPFEFINTNIIGAQNVVEAALANKVKKIIALSTDKACSPINLYGATKLCSDKLFISSNNLVSSSSKTKFSVVRYGNVFASRGSIIPLFSKIKKEKKPYPLTDIEMTRFNISMDDAIEAVLWAFKNSKGSELIVPKLKSFKIKNLISAFDQKAKIKIIGIRPGEKIHEELISASDSRLTIDVGKYFLILPHTEYFKKYNKFKKIKEGFVYRSDLNQSKLSILDLKKMIK
jgi:UDP-N-acetylglucosamine 4,6-dehydratase (inverting)